MIYDIPPQVEMRMIGDTEYHVITNFSDDAIGTPTVFEDNYQFLDWLNVYNVPEDYFFLKTVAGQPHLERIDGYVEIADEYYSPPEIELPDLPKIPPLEVFMIVSGLILIIAGMLKR